MTTIVFTVINDLNNDRRMQRICSSLTQAGFSVTLVGRELPDSKPIQERAFQQVRLKCKFHKGKLFYAEYQMKIYNFLNQNAFDIYGAIDLDTALPVLRIAKKRNKACALDLHEYFPEVPEVVNRPIVKWIWESIEKKTVPAFSEVITVSNSLGNIFEEKYHRKVHVIRNLPDTNSDIQPRKLTYDTFTVLYQGALNVGRGLENLIESMQYVEGKLLLAGEGDLSHTLRNRVSELGLEHKITFLGMLNPEELKLQTKSANLGINLLENKGLSYYYSLSNKFFDYIQHAVPQICINFPEYNLINKQFDIAVLIDNFAPQRLANEINTLKSDTGLYERLSVNCLQAALELNWQKEQEQLVKIFKQLG